MYQVYSLEKLQEVAKSTGVDLLDLLAEFPLEEQSGITTENAFERIRKSPNSAYEQDCILAAKMFSVVKTTREAHYLYNEIMQAESVFDDQGYRENDWKPNPNLPLGVISRLGWDRVALWQAESTENYEQLLTLRKHCPSKMEAEAFINKKEEIYWVDKAEVAKTLDQATDVCRQAPEKSKGRRIAERTIKTLITKELRQKTTAAQVKEFYNSHKQYIDLLDSLRKDVFEKWDILSNTEITTTKNSTELKEVKANIRPEADKVLTAFTAKACEFVEL